MSQFAKRALHWFGSAIALIGIAFVFLRLYHYEKDLDFQKLSIVIWWCLLALSLLYASANLLLSRAWWHLLAHLKVNVTHKWSIRTYGVSQLAKYVPGNIFQFAGRQALGMAAGVPSGVLAKSSLCELALISAAGVSYAWLVLPLLMPGFSIAIIFMLLFVSMLGTVFLLNRIISTHVAAAFSLYLLFLFISSGVFAALLYLIASHISFYPKTWLLIICAYITAWLAGLVTPGAPAGIGVREFILLLLLKGVVSESDLLMIILLGRITTVLGDILYFISASFIPTKCAVFKESND